MGALRILLAEDTLMNREIVSALLREQGHEVLAVSDGAEAVAAFLAGSPPFDLVILDVEMPGLSGPQAAVRIRESESGTGRRVPILAMTGHREEAERERCLVAGMDAFFSKPVRPDALIETVDSVLGAKTSLDWDRARRALGGREGLLKKVVAAFLEEAPGQIESLRGAIASKDHETFRRAAHTLHGAMRHFDAPRAIELASSLEDLGRAGSTAGAADLARELEAELTRLTPALEEFVMRSDGGRN